MKPNLKVQFITAPEIIRRRRLSMGYSQQEVATMLGVHIRQYQRLEYGERSIASTNMKLGLSVCVILNIDPFELMFDDGTDKK